MVFQLTCNFLTNWTASRENTFQKERIYFFITWYSRLALFSLHLPDKVKLFSLVAKIKSACSQNTEYSDKSTNKGGQ